VPRPTTLQRNLLLDLSSAIGLGTTMAIVGVLLPSAARREGLDSLGLAVLAALPFLASMMSLLAGRIGPHTPGRLALVRALGSAGLLVVLIEPHPLLLAVATFGFWGAFSLGVPLQQRLWATMYPSHARGRFLGIVGTGRFAAGTVVLLAISLAATSAGWQSIIAIVAVVGMLSAVAVSRLSLPRDDARPSYSVADSFRSVLQPPMLRRITLAQLFFGGGMVATPALIAMIHIDRLGLGIEDIALAGLAGYAMTTLAFGVWGRVASRIGALPTIALGTMLGSLAIALFVLAPDFGAVILATALLGTAGAAVDVSWPLLLADHAPHEEQGSAAAGMNAIMGIRGLITPFLVMVPIQAGLIDETGGLALCLMATAVGAGLYVRMSGLSRLPLSVVASLRPWLQSPASATTSDSSSSGWPVVLRSRLMRSTMAGWVLKRPLTLLSSFFTGLTT